MRATEEKQTYLFKGEKVHCTYMEYLYLKLCYGVGLTESEYQEYKAYSTQ